MRIYSTFIVLILSCTLFACAPRSGRAPAFLGKRVPYTRITKIDGSTIPIGLRRSQPTVVVFWATWCHFSRPVVEELNSIAQSSEFRSTRFIAVSLDKKEKLEELKERIYYSNLTGLQHGFSGLGFYDGSYQALSGNGDLPHVLVIDANGYLLAEGHSADIFTDLHEL